MVVQNKAIVKVVVQNKAIVIFSDQCNLVCVCLYLFVRKIWWQSKALRRVSYHQCVLLLMKRMEEK